MRFTLLTLLCLAGCGPHPAPTPDKYPVGTKVQLKIGVIATVFAVHYADFLTVNALVASPNGQQCIQQIEIRESEIEGIAK